MGTDISFGRLLRMRRRALDMTQEALARQVGYSVITIRKVESDERRPSRQLVERLANSLRIAPEQRPAFTALARDLDQAGSLVDELGDDPVGSAPTGPVSNVPTPLTRLIGREHELAKIRAILLRGDVRLVTLAGPPGIGKSQLGVRVAATVQDAFPDGVWYVPLEPISDASLVASTVVKAIGLKESTGVAPAAALIQYLRDRRVLLVLDNFEHLLDAATMVADVLTACPETMVLVTSRARLGVRGERVHPVPPLATPVAEGEISAAAAARYPAVELFLERAQAVRPGFGLTDLNAADVCRICSDLDGLPLAIELVAARCRYLTPAELLARLGDRLALLTDGPRDLPAHQRTLRGTIDWSYNLLSPQEQVLFARLAVFIGGCSLPAAERVANAVGRDARPDLPLPVLDGLAGLADKNLLRYEERIDGQQYAVLLATIREYALERLADSGEEAEVRDRYAAYCLELAETSSGHLGADQQEKWLDRMDAEHHNLCAALSWYVERGEVDLGLRMLAALWTFWHIRFRQADGLRFTARVMALPGPHDRRVRAKALFGAGWLAVDQCDHALAHTFFTDSLNLYQALGDQHGVATALHGVGTVAQAGGDDGEAAALFAESLRRYREVGDDEGIAWSLDHLGNATLGMGDYARADELFTDGLAIFRRLRHSWGTALALHHQGLSALALGRHDLAQDRFSEAMAVFTELSNGWGVAVSLYNLGHVALATGDHRRAEEYFARSLRSSYAEDNTDGVARALAGLASLAVAERDMVLAARLFGGAETLAEASGIRMDPVARSVYLRDADAVRDRMDAEAVARAWAAGRGMSMPELLAAAGRAS
jgi:predicted ATPase/transcriptional regulator with XRE-family HTH domain